MKYIIDVFFILHFAFIQIRPRLRNTPNWMRSTNSVLHYFIDLELVSPVNSNKLSSYHSLLQLFLHQSSSHPLTFYNHSYTNPFLIHSYIFNFYAKKILIVIAFFFFFCLILFSGD